MVFLGMLQLFFVGYNISKIHSTWKETKKERKMAIKARKPNVQFKASRATLIDDFKNYGLLQVDCLRTTKIEHQRFVEYGGSFMF